jgi:hypothetical protein
VFIVLWKHKPIVVIENLVTSILFVSFTHTWILSHRKKKKKRVNHSVNVVNLNSTVREEEVHWTEFRVFNFFVPTNYDFSVLYVQFICV